MFEKPKDQVHPTAVQPGRELEVDTTVDRQLTSDGPLLFWWNDAKGKRKGAVCAVEFCPTPSCPCREATLHALLVDERLVGAGLDGEGRVITKELAEGPESAMSSRRASMVVLFDEGGRRTGRAEGDAELVRRLRDALDESVIAAIEQRWERTRAGEDRARGIRRPGRNDPCPCGSGRKFKKCCLNRSWRAVRLPGSPATYDVCIPLGTLFGGGGTRDVH
jgi:hypothetical protein